MTALSHHFNFGAGTKRTFNFWFVEGVLLVLFGLAAIAFPMFAGISAAVLLSWILMGCGIAGLFGAFSTKPRLHFGWSTVSAVLAIGAGLIAALNPAAGIFALIVVITAWLGLDGLSSIMIALHLRRTRARSWGWLAASAATDWLLAIGLVVVAPFGGALVVGVIVGIDLVLGGVLLLTAALETGA